MKSLLHLLVPFLGLAVQLPASAAFGDADPSFSAPGGCGAIAVREDGGAYIDAVGSPAVLRITSNGAPDTSWGNGGTAVYPTDPNSTIPSLVFVVQLLTGKDGDLFVMIADFGAKAGGVVHLLPNGSVDKAYGNGGRARTGYILSGALQADGKVVLLTTEAASLSAEASFQRLTAQGQLDSSFAAMGVDFPPSAPTVSPSESNTVGQIYGWALRDDGNVEIAYFRPPPFGSQDIQPLLIIGHSDHSVTQVLGGRLVPQGIATWMSPIAKVEPTGALVIANGITLRRFLPDGTYDSSFNANAVAPPIQTGATSHSQLSGGLWREPDGSWTLASSPLSSNFVPVNLGVWTMRFNAQGIYDASFGETRLGLASGPIVRTSDGHLLFATGLSSRPCTLGRYSTDSVRQESTVVEYYAPSLDHYFMTSTPNEITVLDGNPSFGWVRTGQSFGGWAPGGQPDAAHVCRFYGDPVIGPNSHFYTAEDFECQELISLAAATPPGMPAWRLEGKPFDMAIPSGGACPSNLRPVYRVFNDIVGPVNGPNHRYTTDPAVYAAMQAKGWVGEGVHFCTPPRLN